MQFCTVVLACTLHNAMAEAGCGTSGFGYTSTKYIRVSGTGSACGCQTACCYQGVVGASAWTYNGTCFCQQDSIPLRFLDSGSTSDRCNGDLMHELGVTPEDVPLPLDTSRQCQKYSATCEDAKDQYDCGLYAHKDGNSWHNCIWNNNQCVMSWNTCELGVTPEDVPVALETSRQDLNS